MSSAVYRDFASTLLLHCQGSVRTLTAALFSNVFATSNPNLKQVEQSQVWRPIPQNLVIYHHQIAIDTISTENR